MLFCLQFFYLHRKKHQAAPDESAKIRSKQIATEFIRDAITERISQNTNFDKLIDWRTDSTGKVKGLMINYAEHTRITADTIDVTRRLLHGLKETKEYIPLGQAMNSPILASFGPHIPIRLIPAGDVNVDLKTRSQNNGINMVVVEVYVKIVAAVTVIVPFDSETEIVETELPLSYSLIVGDVPMYYFDNKGNPVGSASGAPPSGSVPNLPFTPSAAPAA